jgi:integrative and conjugative element protein (TIGR02256 family)
MMCEAEDKYPLETGGVLVGYWSEDGREVVITAVSGPGPKAIHSKSDFTPDYLYQDQFVASAYARSGRRHTYLGDWHTHPDGGTKLSGLDKRTLRRISRAQDARAAAPIMVIVANDGASWEAAFWNYRPGTWFRVRPFGGFVELSVRGY